MDPIWKAKVSPEDLNELGKNTLTEHLGIVFTEIGEDYIKAKMPVNNHTRQPMGLLHGGASVVLAETLGSIAATYTQWSERINPVVGIEINANHLKSVKEGWVTGRVTPIRIGKRLQVWNIIIYNDQGEEVCISRLTTMVIESV